MSFNYPFTINIRDTYQLELFLNENGFTQISSIQSENGVLTINNTVQLNEEQLETMTNLIFNVYTNPYPDENTNSTISSINSSDDTLVSYQAFQGDYEDISNFSSVSILINSDQTSLKFGVEVYFSTDGISDDFCKKYSYAKNSSFVEMFSSIAKYFKIIYKNGGVSQTAFTLQTIFHLNRQVNRHSTTQQESLKIEEENNDTKTKGHFRSQGFSVTAAANSDTIHDFTFPYDIAPLVIKFKSAETHRGDILNLQIAPNVIVGVATQNIISGNNYFYVTPSSLDYLNIGYTCSVTDGATTNILGDIIDIDYSSSKITTNIAFTDNFNVGSYVRMTVMPMVNYIISEPGEHTVGDSKIGASYIPKNNIIRLIYTNNSNSSKTFVWQTEMLY